MTYTTIESLFTGICDAIREKDGTTDLISHQDIPERIAAISSGGSGGEVFLSPFYTYNGSGMKIENGVASNFATSSCVFVGKAFRPMDKQWEIQVKFKTPASWVHVVPTIFSSIVYRGSVQCGFEIVNNARVIWFGFSNNNGSSWTHSVFAYDYEIEYEKWYWLRCVFNGEKYIVSISTDGEVFEEIIIINYNGQFYQPENNNSFMFGGSRNSSANIFDGSIDLKETYIKIEEEIWWGKE